MQLEMCLGCNRNVFQKDDIIIMIWTEEEMGGPVPPEPPPPPPPPPPPLLLLPGSNTYIYMPVSCREEVAGGGGGGGGRLWFKLLDHNKWTGTLSHQKLKLTFRCKNHYKCCHRTQEFPGRGAVSPPLDSNALKGVAIVCSVSKTSEHKCELIRGHIEWRWHFIYPVRCLVDLPEYLDATHFKGSEHHIGTWDFQVRGSAFYSSSPSIGLLPRYC